MAFNCLVLGQCRAGSDFHSWLYFELLLKPEGIVGEALLQKPEVQSLVPLVSPNPQYLQDRVWSTVPGVDPMGKNFQTPGTRGRDSASCSPGGSRGAGMLLMVFLPWAASLHPGVPKLHYACPLPSPHPLYILILALLRWKCGEHPETEDSGSDCSHLPHIL